MSRVAICVSGELKFARLVVSTQVNGLLQPISHNAFRQPLINGHKTAFVSYLQVNAAAHAALKPYKSTADLLSPFTADFICTLYAALHQNGMRNDAGLFKKKGEIHTAGEIKPCESATFTSVTDVFSLLTFKKSRRKKKTYKSIVAF